MCVWHVEQVRVGLRKDKSLPSIVERQYISEWEKNQEITEQVFYLEK